MISPNGLFCFANSPKHFHRYKAANPHIKENCTTECLAFMNGINNQLIIKMCVFLWIKLLTNLASITWTNTLETGKIINKYKHIFTCVYAKLPNKSKYNSHAINPTLMEVITSWSFWRHWQVFLCKYRNLLRTQPRMCTEHTVYEAWCISSRAGVGHWICNVFLGASEKMDVLVASIMGLWCYQAIRCA